MDLNSVREKETYNDTSITLEKGSKESHTTQLRMQSLEKILE